MKKTRIILMMAVMIIAASCNHTVKTTEDEVKKAEAALFNDNLTTNVEAVPSAIEVFSKYAEENPDAANAEEYLFKAFEVSVNTKQDPKQSIDLAERFLKAYPKSDKAAVTLFMLASFVYDDQLHDLNQARAAYQRVVDNYPESPFADDAEVSIKHLGLTPEELIRIFESQADSER